MIEDVPLTSQDVDQMLQNLMTDGFTGYVRNALGNTEGFFFIKEGELCRAVQRGKTGDCKVLQQGRLLTTLQDFDSNKIPTSSYVLSPRICEVLSTFFAFKHYYKDYQVKKKELKKILTSMETDQFSGIVQFETKDGPVCVVLDKGEPVNDQYAKAYGQILCGRDAITNLFEYVHANGSRMQVYAEKSGDIDTKVRKSNDELEQMRTLRVKPGSGLFAVAKDQIRLDDEIAREWGIENRNAFNVIVELSDGKRFECKCSAKKGKGDQLEVGAKVIKDKELFEGQEVFVFPAPL